MNSKGPHPRTSIETQALRYDKGVLSERTVVIAEEVPYTLFVNENEILSVSTLPSNLKELFVGFLVSEGVLTSPEELTGSLIDHENKLVAMDLAVPEERVERLERKGMLTSGCAGGMTFAVDMSVQPRERKAHPLRVSAPSIVGRMYDLDTHPGLYRTTRGVHGAAVATPWETLTILEDIGRHNAVDKIVGYCFLNKIESGDKLLLTTGRVTSEVLIKASRGGFSIVISRSSASAMALRLAEQCSIDVATYVRAGRFNYFSHHGVELVAE